MTPIPVRRTGFRRWFKASRDELKRAISFAELEARKVTIFESPEAVCRWMVWCVGEQLGHSIGSTIDGMIGPEDRPLICIHMQDVFHYMDTRDIEIASPLELTSRATGRLMETFSHKPGQPPSPGIAAALAEVKAKMETPAKAKQSAKR